VERVKRDRRRRRRCRERRRTVAGLQLGGGRTTAVDKGQSDPWSAGVRRPSTLSRPPNKHAATVDRRRRAPPPPLTYLASLSADGGRRTGRAAGRHGSRTSTTWYPLLTVGFIGWNGGRARRTSVSLRHLITRDLARRRRRRRRSRCLDSSVAWN